MRQVSWVVAYIDSAELPRRGWPRPLSKLPEIFNILRRADERVSIWQLPDLEANQLAESLREAAAVVLVVPVPVSIPETPVLYKRRDASYGLLKDSWRYQLQYLDPGTERRLGR